jgi:hypothetical protein
MVRLGRGISEDDDLWQVTAVAKSQDLARHFSLSFDGRGLGEGGTCGPVVAPRLHFWEPRVLNARYAELILCDVSHVDRCGEAAEEVQ